MKIVVAEKIAGAAMKVLEAIPNSTVVTPGTVCARSRGWRFRTPMR